MTSVYTCLAIEDTISACELSYGRCSTIYN